MEVSYNNVWMSRRLVRTAMIHTHKHYCYGLRCFDVDFERQKNANFNAFRIDAEILGSNAISNAISDQMFLLLTRCTVRPRILVLY